MMARVMTGAEINRLRSGVRVRARVGWADLVREPFRLFFPAAVVAGLLGVLAWPLHFAGILPLYPGAAHARLMAHGFFAGFMLGFLGTALPRMLSAPTLRAAEVFPLLALHGAMAVALFLGRVELGDALFALLLLGFGAVAGLRVVRRRDLPPPGFVLVALAFLCAAAGILLALVNARGEPPVFWVQLQHLLSYQGFLLLPILGVGGFLLPRFFQLPNRHDFPESLRPSAAWKARAGLALAAGVLIVVSLVLEAAGWRRTGLGLRLGVTLGYLLWEVPLYRGGRRGDVLALVLRWSVGLLAAGFLAVLLFPSYRIALLHLTLVGGFAGITLAVATRVVFGHSGNQALLGQPNRWFKGVLGLMLVALFTRISGDFWPKILVTHYSYGALLWAAAVAWWAWKVLPKVRVPDPEK